MSEMDKIAVFIEQTGIDHNASIVNCLEFLSDHFAIDLFLRRVWPRQAAVMKNGTLHAVEIRERLTASLVWEWGKDLARKLLALDWPGLRHWHPLGWDGMAGRDAKTRFPAHGYRCLIAFDPRGLLLCKELFPKAQPFYYSLELYLPSDRPNPFQSRTAQRQLEKVVSGQERLLADIRGLIIQSREREALFREGFHLRESIPTLLLPVTAQGKASSDKSDFVRRKYGLAKETKIALHLGGIYGCYSGIELARAFATIPGWVLLFQGLANRDYLRQLQAVLRSEAIRNTIISTDFFNQLTDLEPILMSADVGIAWYNDISPNFTTIGRSSGKIASYLKFGLPVIANRYPSTEEAIAEHGCGVCVDDFASIPAAIGQIAADYERCSSRCRATYDDIYNFENYHQALMQFIAR